MASNDKQIKRVLTKLNELFLEGSDFTDRRWVFDWDDNLSTDENLDNAWNEDRALQTITQAGVIKSRSTENEYKHQHDKSVAAHGEKAIVWGDWYTTDPARREYEWERWLDGFDHKNFQRFCELHGFNPSNNGVLTRLEIGSGVTPVIYAQGDKFRLLSLTAGSVPQAVIAYIATKLDAEIGLDELSESIDKVQLKKKDANLRQIFKNNVFATGNLLASFAEINPNSILLKREALLTPTELVAIQKASTN